MTTHSKNLFSSLHWYKLVLKIQIMSHVQRSLDIYGFLCVITNIDDVRRKRRYGRNILLWSKNDFKSRINTNGDYFFQQRLAASRTDLQPSWQRVCIWCEMSWVQIPVTALVACHNNSNNSKTNSNQIDTILNLIEQLNQFKIPRKTDCNFSKTSLSLYQSCNLFVCLSHPQRKTITAIIMCAVYFDQ